jgi:tRNA modification GTPase
MTAIKNKEVDSLAYFKRVGTPIVAVATALGGPVAILRVSGKSLSFLEKLFGPLPESSQASLKKIKSVQGEFLDQALVLYFKAPHSFSGEDVVEIQGHGAPALVEKIQEEIVSLGAVPALPGEFSFRAVLNEKMTLEEASRLQSLFAHEGLGASSASKLLSFSDSHQEALDQRLFEALDAVAMARGRVEAAIDFSEAEEEQAADIASADERLSEVQASLQNLLNSYEVFSQNSRIPRVVLLGRPNSGKSTLLNIFCGSKRSIVSAQAGTTRDYVEVTLKTPKGFSFRLIDTAGLRRLGEGADTGFDPIEAEGMEQGLELLSGADVLIWLQDAREFSENFGDERVDAILSARTKILQALTHGDLLEKGSVLPQKPYFLLSKEGAKEALFELMTKLDQFFLQREALAAQAFSEDKMISQRQEALLKDALADLTRARASLQGARPLELVGDDLRSLEALIRRAKGEDLNEDYIGKIFSQFCLGK